MKRINKPNRVETKHKCTYCKVVYYKYVSPSRGTKFCSLQCSGKARAIGREEVKKRHAIYLKEKMENDPEFREKRLARKRAYYFERHEHFLQKNKERREQDGYYEIHNEYCRQPEYSKKKKSYDRLLRCKKGYGEFWEAASILIDLENKLRPHKYEIRKINGTINKALQRSRNDKIKRSYT